MSKTITIIKSIYDELIGFKKNDESFSELLDRLMKSQNKKDLLLSLRGSIEFEDKEKLLAEIEKKRWERRNWFFWIQMWSSKCWIRTQIRGRPSFLNCWKLRRILHEFGEHARGALRHIKIPKIFSFGFVTTHTGIQQEGQGTITNFRIKCWAKGKIHFRNWCHCSVDSNKQ